MGKILKFCNSCEEGFAERFTFCPDCGGSLQAVELNPVEPVGASQPEPVIAAVEEPQAPSFIQEEVSEPVREMVSGEPTPDEIEFASAPTEEIPAVEEEPVIEAPAVVASQPAKSRRESPAFMTAPGILFESEPKYADEVRHTIPAPLISKDGEGYSITVIEEKGGQRNGLLLAATAFAVVVALGSWAVSLFNKSLDLGAIGDDQSLAYLLDDVPMPTEEEPEKPKNDKDAGGGGGGGREEKDPVDRGDLANQTEKPLRAPDAKTYRSDDTELKLPPASTEGNKQFEQKYNQYGDPNAKYTGIASNGPGRGGGLGTGDGTGQGSGSGTGAGSGSGSGYGGGSGSGNGDGTGAGDGRAPAPPAARVTQPLRITYKQKAQYTDAARTNGVQGTVTLRVTFLASGGIGSITTVKGLPHGLTEQAIAAARNMKFEPEMAGGVPRTTTRPVSFTFNIY